MNETIAYFYTDRERADLKRSQINSANASSYMIVRSIDWANTIEWSSVFLVIVDYDSDRHCKINEVLHKIQQLDQPPIVVVDPIYKSDEKELHRASELEYFHCIREPLNQTDLRHLIKSARSRFAQERMAKQKWPVVLQKKTLVEIRNSLRSLNPGEINYVLSQLQSHNQIFTKFLMGVNKSKVESKHILTLAKFYKSNSELAKSMLDELKRRGDYFITAGRIQAEILVSESPAGCIERGKSTHDLIEGLLTQRQGDTNMAKKLLAAKVSTGNYSNLGITLQKSLEPGTIDKQVILTGLAEITAVFFNDDNALKASKVRAELERFYSRLNRKVSLVIQKELMVYYHIIISNQYYLQRNHYASSVHSALAKDIYSNLGIESRKAVLVPMILISIWRGEITDLSHYIKFGEQHVEGFRIKGVPTTNHMRYQNLLAYYNRIRTESFSMSLLKRIQEHFPHSQMEQLMLNKVRGENGTRKMEGLSSKASMRLEKHKQKVIEQIR